MMFIQSSMNQSIKRTMNRSSINGSRAKGFSIVELMIAGALGLILLGGVISLFLGTRVSYRMQDQLANVQTDGRFALMFFERTVENAGWFQNTAPSFGSAIDFTQSLDGGPGGSDSIAVQQEIAAGTGVDCNGTAVAGTVLINRLFMNGTTLSCQGNGGAAAQPVIENVDSFQILYGVDSDNDGVVNQYMTATQVGASGVSTKVVALQMGLLVATQDGTLTEAAANSFDVLDDTSNYNDFKVRRMFKQTVNLPNQAFTLVGN